MTMYRSAIVYESHTPGNDINDLQFYKETFKFVCVFSFFGIENFEMFIFNATPLYVLDICDVCGSYQCPYCPYFSAAPIRTAHPVALVALCSLLSLLAHAFFHLGWFNIPTS